jgi:glycosyltransferase involved in cell wall biosynthesis/GT2 family glycosyltransferase/uncharacterized coiled-coil protein SlyX
MTAPVHRSTAPTAEHPTSQIKEIERLHAELAGFGEKLGTREVTISRLRRAVAHLEARCTELEERLAARQTDLEHLTDERHRQASELSRSCDELASLSAEVERLTSDVRAVHDSTSWRVTAPMRGLKNAVMRLRSRLSRATVRPTSPPVAALAVNDEVTLVSRSGLFDPTYYAAQASGLPETHLDLVVHYLARGATEGLNPHPLFDTSFYCAANPGAVTGVNPIIHYLREGAAEGRDPHPLFDTSFYREQNPDVAASGENPLLHYLRVGACEGRDPHPLFDTSFYREQNPDVAASEENPLLHYLRVGAGQDRDPHPLFDSCHYRRGNPGGLEPQGNPLLHYLSHGGRDVPDPHPLFETSFYLEQNPDVGALGVNPLVHFVAKGPTPAFDPLSRPRPLPDTGICIVTPDLVGPVKNGGIGTACYHFARILAQAGRAVSVLFTCDLSTCRQAHWRNTYARMGIKFIPLEDTPPVTHEVLASNWFLERSWRVFQYLERHSYSVIHFQDWHANGFWSIKAKQVGLAFEGTTLTVMTHSPTKWQDDGMQQFGPEPIETAKLVWAEAYTIEHCDVLLSPTRYMLDWLSQNDFRKPQSVFVTPNAYTENTEEGGALGDVDNDHLIFFGRLETRKGLHVFGEALRLLRREGRSLPHTVSLLGTLVTVNGRPAAEYLAQLREDLAPIDVRVIDTLDHAGARDYIERTRGLVVIPSLVDNCPFVVIESIENRLPFLAAKTGGIPDMVDSRATFEPTVTGLAARLAERDRIDHAGMRHPYSVRDATGIWRHLHGDEGPFGGRSPGSWRPARDAGESPRVSVCIPFFDQDRYLATLVAAFDDQSYANLEILVVNDGSGPEASREFDRVAADTRDGRFRFLTTENRGRGAARNAAAEAATGDLLLFFDADNVPKSRDFVATLVRALRWAGADCVTCAYDIVDPSLQAPAEEDVMSTYRPFGPCLEAGFFQNVLGGATMILPRSVFTQVGGFPTERASWEAHEFLLRLSFQGFRLETFPEALFYRRECPYDGNQQANHFLRFRSLFEQLRVAPSKDLARILTVVGGPMLLERFGAESARIAGR